MKKTLVAGVAALAFATAAFAEITFSTWGRAIAAPVAGNGNETVAGLSQSWGGAVRTTGLSIDGVTEDEKAGFSMAYRNHVDTEIRLAGGDQAILWLKPVDQVKISIGKFDHNALRGDLCYGSWDWLRPGCSMFENSGDEKLTFDGTDGTGMLFELFPVESLYAYVRLPYSTSIKSAEDVYKATHAAAGYSIDGVGKLKVGYFGKGETTSVKEKEAYYQMTFGDDKEPSLSGGESKEDGKDYNGDLEAAFDLTAVENLFVTVGAKFALKDSDYFKEPSGSLVLAKDDLDDEDVYDAIAGRAYYGAFRPSMTFALGASYQVTPELKVSASGKVLLFDTVKVEDDGIKTEYKVDPAFVFGAGIDYALADNLKLLADVRYFGSTKIAVDSNDEGAEEHKMNLKDDHVAFMVGIDYAINGNATIGAAFQGITNGGNLGGFSCDYPEAKYDSFVWALPIKIQVGL